MKNIIVNNKKGFTIIETLVAITILMIAVAGPLTIAQKSLMASIYARDQVTASYLAQELMEQKKNIKRSNWGTDICPPGAPATIELGKYNRTCTTQILSSDGTSSVEEKITVTVTWDTNGVLNSMVLVSSIFNIKL